ncbi:MAG: MarR family transcriptional regulator [Verrucomicrobia bacterium]|nr:MarR family transcriptional regulator [Verrucomicrobiota bacterium]
MKSQPGRDYALVVAVLSTADAFLRESQRLFRPLGLSGAQFNVLNLLADAADGMSQRELGDRLLVDRSNVTGLLDRMEKAGWVRRKDHPADRRVYLVSLTPAGHALWAKAHALYLDVIAQVTAGLPAKRMDDCTGVLAHLEKNAATWELADHKS